MLDHRETSDGTLEAVYAAAIRLLRRKDDHPLLFYARHFSEPGVWDDFLDHFGRPDEVPELRMSPVALAFARYTATLREACSNTDLPLPLWLQGTGAMTTTLGRVTS